MAKLIAHIYDIISFRNSQGCVGMPQSVEVYITRSDFCKVLGDKVMS